MTDYNLGTARGRIVLDARGAVDGANEADQAASRVGGSFEKAAGPAGKLGGVLAIGAGAVAAGFGAAVNSAADFEKQISGIAAVSNATGPELESIRQKALQLGKDTQFSASEAAAAIEELVKAGVPLADVLNGAADASVALAAAGGVGIPEAATLASNAMNAFGIEAKDLSGVVDQIAGAANASAIDVGEFGQSLQQVGAVAHLAGLNFADTAVAIAEMGNAGIKGSDAGTSLKSFLSNLIPTTEAQNGLFLEMGLLAVDSGTAMQKLAKEGIKPASDSFDDIIDAIIKYNAANGGAKEGTVKAQKEALKMAQTMGVVRNQFFDATGKTKSLKEIQDLLAQSTANMTKEQKLANLQILFGSDAIRAAAVLADNGAAGYDKLSQAMNSTSAADVAKKRMDNLKGSVEQMKGSLETAGIVIGTILIPAVRKAADFVTRMLNAFLNLNPNVQKAILIFVGVLTVLAGIVGTILLVVAAVGAIIGPLTAIAGIIGIGVGALLGWIVIIPIIIAALAVLIFFIVKNWGKIKDFIGKVLNAIKGFFVKTWNAIYAFFKPIIQAIYGVIKFVFDLILAYFKFIFNLYATIITTALNIILGIWKAIWGLFGPLITAFLGAVLAFIKFVFVLIAVIVYQTLRGIFALWKLIWGGMKAFLTPIVQFYLTIIRTVFNAIKTVITTVINFIKPYVVGAFNIIKNALLAVGSIVAKVVGFFAAIGSGIADKVARIVTFMTGIGGKILHAIGDLSHLLFDVGKKIIQGLIDGITHMFGSVKDTLGNLTGKLADWKGPASKDKILLEQNGVLIMKSLIAGFADQIPEVKGTLQNLTDEIPVALSTQTNAPQVVIPAQAAPPKGDGERNITLEVNNYNPIAEPDSVSTTKAVNRLAALGV